jgi:hypothetical protein
MPWRLGLCGEEGILAKYEAAVKGFDGLQESLKAGSDFYSDLRSLYIDVLFAVSPLINRAVFYSRKST